MVLELDTPSQGYKTIYFYFTFYQCMEQVLLSLQVMKMQWDIKGLHIVSNEFCRFMEGGLAI